MTNLPRNRLLAKREKPKDSWYITLFKELYRFYLIKILVITAAIALGLLGGLAWLIYKTVSWISDKVREFFQEPEIPEPTLEEMYAGMTGFEIEQAIWEKWNNNEELTADESIYLFATTMADEQRRGIISEEEIQEIQNSIGISDEELIENVIQNLPSNN